METNQVTEAVIGCAIRVSNTLGCGYLEKVYENALVHECRKQALSVDQQKCVPVFYDGLEVGLYVADLIVESQVLVELKAARAIDHAHQAQLLNYLKATGLRTGLILNFGTPHLGVRRMVL